MTKPASLGLCLILIVPSLLDLILNVYAIKQLEEDTFLHDVCQGTENLVKFDVYLHDRRVGNADPTVYTVAKASITPNSPTSFGTVNAVDDLLTVGPDISSTAVGRIQGLTTSADMAVSGVALNLNIVFTAGQFNGSTISLLGRNEIMEEERELAVAGGTGAFRFARGYAIQTTSLYDAASFYGVFKFTIYTTYNSRFSQIDEVRVVEL